MNKNLTQILEKLSLSDAENTMQDILRIYAEKNICIVHFLYFANIILNKLDEENTHSSQKKAFIQALLDGDFLLPDGIALKLLYEKYFKKELPNLNGTDFLPYFFSHIPKDKKVEIFLYGASPEVIGKTVEYIKESFNFPVISAQHGFQEFDWSKMSSKEKGIIRILLVGRGSPLQEIWGENNKEKIKANECLVFTVGGLLDFWSGTEKRAPEWMRKCKIEWLYRALSNPKKNLKKTLVSLKLLQFLIKK
ncbi:MAG: WecB/TagA/CpsF family glycosyltransferase [Candidatus Gracilibacteria bacterium]|jgi:exopolysaccharide biosynthesis WecB/TagA/CpsF family protein